MPGKGRKKQGRARKGTGTIYEYRPGRFRGMLDLGVGADGKRIRVSTTGGSVEEVQQKLDAMKQDVLRGLPINSEKLTVGEYLARWLEDAARPAVRPSTHVRYAAIIRIHVAPRIGAIPLAKLSPVHVQGLYADLERAGVSPRMRQFTHAVLHRALNQAVKWRLVSHNACDAVDRPRVPRKEVRTLDAEQARRLLEAARGDRLEALCVLALTTGMRQGELLGLQWEDVDLKAGTVSVRRTLLELNGKLAPGETKSGRPRRVDLPDIAVEALREHRKRMLAEGHPGPWVFCDTRGGPIRRNNIIRRWFKPLVRRAGLPDIRFHDLRHTAATLLLRLGVHPKVVQERLGHSQIGVTLDTYSHVLPSMQKEAARKLDAIFRPAR
ncbi:MAG: site-specific integrase [Thermoflexus sp.]|uniref:tyrosine-type recombinase/integrase n=1 Tax=Thermoflexus sp. TaxID=1969742 RepID=UPI00331FC6C4